MAFGLLIFVHELGHFLAARAVGIKVNDFSLGMGPRLWHFRRGETDFSLRAIPIGGSCSMEGETDESFEPRAFTNKPRLSRALLRRRAWPEWPLASLRLAASYVGWLWAAGAVAVIVSMVWHHASVRETLGIADGGAGLFGLLLLSVGYLPNIAFGAAGVLVGAPANVGVAEAGLFAVSPGTLPPLPTLAAMPQSHLPRSGCCWRCRWASRCGACTGI